MPRERFHKMLVAQLAHVTEVDFAFLARCATKPVPMLQALGFHGAGAMPAVAALRPAVAIPAGLLDVLDERGEERLRDWLLESGWLPPIDPQDVRLRLLRGCDGGAIGILGIADRNPMSAGDRRWQAPLAAFAALAERVIERDDTVAAVGRERSQLEAIIDAAMDAIVIVDQGQRIVRFNAAAEAMFGRTAAEVLGQRLQLLLPEEILDDQDRHGVDGGHLGASRRRTGALGEVPGRRRDGSEFPAEVALSRIGDGRGCRYTVVVRDLTARKRALERIASAETRFLGLVEQSLVGIFIVQRQRLRYVNPHLARMLGCASPEELLDLVPIAELIVPAQRARVTALVRDCLAGRRHRVREEIRVLRRDGGVIEVELHGQSFEFEGRLAIIGVVLDVTERSRIERALRQSEQLFRSMFESMHEGVAIHELVLRDGRIADYRLVDVNAAFERHTGIRAGDARGRLASELYGTGVAPFLDRYGALAPGGPPTAFETYVEPLGRRFSVSAFSLDRQRFVSVFQDVTKQRRLEAQDRDRAEELTRTGGLLTLGEMASTLAHELNQPLTSIANYSAGCLARIDGGGAAPGALREVLKVICEEAERAGRTLNGIRRFMERHEFNPAPVDANVLTAEALSLSGIARTDGRIAVNLELQEALPAVMADRVLIQVVLVNLIRNAVEAIEAAGPGGGRLDIRTASAAGGGVECCVRDSGCGLPPGGTDQIFRAFFSTKHAGLGLGLAIARSIVESHGGRIWATRNAEAGTAFHFTLKAAVAGKA